MNRIILIFLAIVACTVGARGQQLTASTTVTPPTNKNTFHIYLLMGQSNMAGRDTRRLTSQVDHPRVLALDTNDQGIVARDPLHPRQGRTEAGPGAGIPFAREMLKADT